MDGDVRIHPGSETQRRSVGPGEKARRKFSSTGGKAPVYRLSPDHFQTVKRILAPDWAQKCFVLLCPIGEQPHLSYFCEFVHDGYRLDHGLPGSCTKEKCTKSGNFQYDINSPFQNTGRFSENTSLSLQQVFTLASITSS